MIDNYIARCQTEDININVEFSKLLRQIVADANKQILKFDHDIDLLFKDTITGKIYYLECQI
ncbi:MAG: hypothetical protein LBB92_02660 [Endomicrobium sp.]|nr:hypothetical protein [Endomicrobium sp.]